MKVSDLQDIALTQKQLVNKQDFGLERQLLPKIPDIQGHALVISGIRREGI